MFSFDLSELIAALAECEPVTKQNAARASRVLGKIVSVLLRHSGGPFDSGEQAPSCSAAMSAIGKTQRWISPEEYLQGELLSEVRHEYFAGEVVAMAGASVNHNFIAGNIFAALHAHLAGKKCFAFINDMKAHIHQRGDDWFYYPDVMVNCDPAGQQKYFCETPSVIIEVLSPDTEAKDRREKRLAYEMIPGAAHLHPRGAGPARNHHLPPHP